MNKEAYLLGYRHNTASNEELKKMAYQLAYNNNSVLDKYAWDWKSSMFNPLNAWKGAANVAGNQAKAFGGAALDQAKTVGTAGLNSLAGTGYLANNSTKLLGLDSMTGMAKNTLKGWGTGAMNWAKENAVPLGLGALAVGGVAATMFGGRGKGGGGQGGPNQTYNGPQGPNAMNSHQGSFEQFNPEAFNG